MATSRLLKFGMVAGGRMPAFPQLAIGYATDPYKVIYKYDTKGVFTRIGAPSEIIKNVMCFGYSKDGKWFAAGLNGTAVVNGVTITQQQIFSRAGDGFARIPLTGGSTNYPYCVTFSPDSGWVFWGISGTPYGQVYKQNADKKGYTLIPTTSLPRFAANIHSIQVTKDNTYIAFGMEYQFKWWRRDGDVFTELAMPSPMTNVAHYGVAWSSDGLYLFGACYNATYPVMVYRRDGDSLVKVASVVSPVPAIGAARVIAISPDDKHIVVGTISAPFYAIYKFDRATNVLTRLAPASLPAVGGQVNDISFSDDGKMMIIATSGGVGTGRLFLFQRSGDTFTLMPDLDAQVYTGVVYTAKFGPLSPDAVTPTV